MGIFQTISNALSGERRVPIEPTAPADELDALIAQNQHLGRQADELREQRRAITARIRELIAAKHATVQGQTLEVKAGV